MAKHYVTFGADHTHMINGRILHKNTVARFDAETPIEGREKAFGLFGTRFSMEYHEHRWNPDSISFFPDGYVDI